MADQRSTGLSYFLVLLVAVTRLDTKVAGELLLLLDQWRRRWADGV